MSKSGDSITVTQIDTQAELNKVHFFLLGNRFETLYLPSAILVVEGKTDHKFIERSVNLRFPNSQISVVPANSDSRVKEIVNFTKSIFGDFQKSPYQDRVFVVLDSVHMTGLKEQLIQMGVHAENIITWSMNGIEHFYPPTVLDSIYGNDGDIKIQGDNISRNGLTYTKNELADKVCLSLSEATIHSTEFQEKLMKKLEQKV